MRAITEAEPGSPAQIYFRDLKKYKLLDREQERVLASRFRLKNDQEALHQLIKGNLRLVVKIAKGFWTGNGTSFTDLIQEGNIGLVQAARKFDPLKKVKFSYYASFWIKAYIHKYLMNNHRSVRIGTTQSQRKIFYNFKKIKRRLISEGIDPTPEEISKRLNVPQKDLVEMQQRLEHPDISLNDPLRGRGPEEIGDKLISSSPSAEEKFVKHQLQALLRENARQFRKDLDSREIEILDRRILAVQPVTLKTLGDKYGVSRERIRQVEARIIQKLRDYLLKEFPDIERYLKN
ncbi:MAG: sigma-70 family RNA polymerase sigma factor [Desulfobacterales bacterium]